MGMRTFRLEVSHDKEPPLTSDTQENFSRNQTSDTTMLCRSESDQDAESDDRETGTKDDKPLESMNVSDDETERDADEC